ncbi:ABC transporter ATP-binding protein [Thermoactinomyces mirandus]|uniref:ABC transporter ATP-binding protein n=1 Tax=Thermoactinomyces mirandus TaxID=2756294 RepID=A0A7W1XUL3_9BACL|nr:ABC transporter ATP-binding protein [Thermoactinomyces mirandus]MBA4603588.1 ABC transporter ATP-binding protein [Thermoactinomyces mirandus]
MIQVHNLYKSYGLGKLSLKVLRAIDLVVDKGEYVAIMGPSGSGKSTLMNILGCLDRPTKGKYYLKGLDVSKMKEPELAQIRNRTIGFIFQQFQLISFMSAKKNVELPLIYSDKPAKEIHRRAISSLERVGLANYLNHKPFELSGGQQQRVAIARALVNNPELLLADEPTGSLDTASGQVVLDLFDELHREGKTIIMITHDFEIAKRAERQVYIRDGRILTKEGFVR